MSNKDHAIVNGKRYGMVEGHPETEGIFSAFMAGYMLGRGHASK